MSWWEEAVFYQIYPRSFVDSDGDGVGDLGGIIERLDYLVALGVDALWISPIFPSPMADFGYDISDYCDVHPMFGDLATFDRLLQAAHARGLKIVLDYVPNHTSDEHAWFIESRSSRDNPRRDWYIWRDPAPDGGPPNNWESFFGGPAWTRDETTGQYYLHLFLPKQPDLNWRNPEVVHAMHDVLHFWLKRGVDGFRMDVVTFLLKHPDFPDNPPASGQQTGMAPINTLEHLYDISQPGVHEVLRGFRRLFDGYDGDRVIIGETLDVDPIRLCTYYGERLDEIHIPFNFAVLWGPWNAEFVRGFVESYYEALPSGAVPNFVLGNHDRHRLATRYGPANVRAAGLLLLTLWGIPTMYYGDEIGMANVPVPLQLQHDPWGLRNPDADVSRDPVRTPMQWDASPNAGFAPAHATPWLPLAADYPQVNVAAQAQDPVSILNFYKALLRLRRQMPVLHRRGNFAFLNSGHRDVLVYRRHHKGETVLVAINFGPDERAVDIEGELLLTTEMDGTFDGVLRPHEGVLLVMKG